MILQDMITALKEITNIEVLIEGEYGYSSSYNNFDNKESSLRILFSDELVGKPIQKLTEEELNSKVVTSYFDLYKDPSEEETITFCVTIER